MNATSATSTVPAPEPAPSSPAAKFLTFVLGPCVLLLLLCLLLRRTTSLNGRKQDEG